MVDGTFFSYGKTEDHQVELGRGISVEPVPLVDVRHHVHWDFAMQSHTKQNIIPHPPPWVALMPREGMHKWREANRRRQLQTAVPC